MVHGNIWTIAKQAGRKKLAHTAGLTGQLCSCLALCGYAPTTFVVTYWLVPHLHSSLTKFVAVMLLRHLAGIMCSPHTLAAALGITDAADIDCRSMWWRAYLWAPWWSRKACHMPDWQGCPKCGACTALSHLASYTLASGAQDSWQVSLLWTLPCICQCFGPMSGGLCTHP